MSPLPGIRPASTLVAIGLLVIAAANALAAGAPMSASQLALYQDADRETILVQGAKRKDSLFSTTRIRGLKLSPSSLRRSIRSSKSRNGAPKART
jgi:hypothetical protein